METCKHCGLDIEQRDGRNWVHADGPQERKRTCALTPYGYDAAPHGEPCVHFCIGRNIEGGK